MTVEDIVDILRCPICGGRLTSGACLSCTACDEIFPLHNGVADMFADALLTDSSRPVAEWRHKLAIHERWWREERRRPGRPGVTVNPWKPTPALVDRYFRFCMVDAGQGRVLDLGCGEGGRAGHFPGKTYVGIDPLALNQTYAFPFLRGLAEFLPFADQTFDVVLAVEVFDHLLDPGRALAEALRVLAPGGALFVFVGVRSDPVSEAASITRQSTYTITEDDVHLHNFNEAFFCEILEPVFTNLESECADGYLSVWGWER